MNRKHISRLGMRSLIVGVWSLLVLLAGCPVGDLTLPGINQDPTANAGADITVDVGQRVTLNGLGSTDADDDPLTYVWQQRSGPPVTLDNANTSQPSFVPVEDGFYEFALTVTDDRGGSDISVVRVFVGDVDPAACPRADAGTDQTVNEGAAVRLRGGNSADPGGRPLTYDWFQLSGPQVSINGVFIAEPTFAAPQVTGADIELEFELKVTNEGGCPDRDTVVITVRDRPGDPCNGVVCADDGLFCNGVEICDDGMCISTGNPCPANETCDEESDECEVPPCSTDADCDDSDACTTDTCAEGACQNTSVDCDDGEWCNGPETCDPETGECVDGDDPCNPDTEVCDEANEVCITICTADAECDDGEFCNGAETCDVETGLCESGTDPCPNDGEFCNGTESCNENLDACESSGDPCAAGQVCVEDTAECVPGQPCTTNADCPDDGVFCNGDEVCGDKQVCVSTGDPCDTLAGEICDEEIDECHPSGGETDTIHSSQWLTGAIDPVADQDAYTFTGQAGQVVFIQVNRTSGGLNPQIRLFAPNGAREALAGDSTFNNHGVAALFEHPIAQSGQYTIFVLDDGLDGTGDYVLSFLNFSGALTSLQDPDGGPIAFDDAKTGAIDPVADQDAYTFTGQAGQVVFIQVNRMAGGLNPQIRLFPPNGGAREALAGDSTFNNHAVAALFEHALAESGQYTILVLDDGLDGTGEYILSLSALP